MKLDLKNTYLLLILISGIIFIAHLEVLWVNIMEARNFITAREMVIDGNWILTTINGEPRYAKPPLPTWLTAISATLFGFKNLFFLRLPAAIMGIILIVFSFKLLKKISQNTQYAFTSALVMATSFYIITASRDANWDIFTHSFMLVCIYFLYQLFFNNTSSINSQTPSKEEKRKIYKNAFFAALFFGCSFLSKGPVSLYALLLPFLIAYGVVYRFNNLKTKLLPLFVFFALGTLLSGWWYAYTYIFDPETVSQITNRETSNWTSYETKPFYYYWSFFVQSGVWTFPAFISLLYPYLKNKVFHKKAYQFTLLWTLISVILLSIIPEKKVRYLLPVMIPLAMNIGFYLEYLFRKFKELKDKRETLPVYFNFGLIGLIGVIFPVVGYFFLREKITGLDWIWWFCLSFTLFIIGVLIINSLRHKNIQHCFLLTLFFIASIIALGMPLATSLTTNTAYKPLSQLHKWQEEQNISVYEFGVFTPELIWDFGQPIKSLKKQKEAIPLEEKYFGVLVAEEDLVQFENTFKGFTLKKITRYDMNPQSPGHKSHRPRLWRDFYLVTR